MQFISKVQNPFYINFKRLKKNTVLNIKLPNKVDDYFNLIVKKKTFLNVHRIEKNINKLGNLKFNIANNSSDCRNIISHMINLKSQQYSRTNVRKK